MTTRTDLTGHKNLPRYFQAAFQSLERIKHGSITVELPDGRVFEARGDAPGPAGRMVVHNDGLFSRLLRDGELGFAESYMDAWWSTPDLVALFDVFLMSNDEVREDVPGMALVRVFERARHWLRSNTKRQARRNISSHYDLGNDFYALWLDPSMTYSSAMFAQADTDLEAAQVAKYENICNIIGARDNHHVLEIGCGWGGFAEHAAKTRGARVTGLTISQAQHDFAKKRMFEQGLNEKVDIVMRDYRDETAKYDGIASIEMFEAVGEKYWPTYFNKVRDSLTDDGVAGLQIILASNEDYDSYRNRVDFIQKYIFPGGMLPSDEALGKEFEAAGLDMVSKVDFGQSYARTLEMWTQSFNDAWDDIAKLGFDGRFFRMWNYYLKSCTSSFKIGHSTVAQYGLRAHG